MDLNNTKPFVLTIDLSDELLDGGDGGVLRHLHDVLASTVNEELHCVCVAL